VGWRTEYARTECENAFVIHPGIACQRESGLLFSKENAMNSIIYWVGFIVILLAVLSFVGVR